MADLRNFAKIDLGYFDNPKINEFVDERPRVPILHLRAILYCRQHLTDGSFPIKAVTRLACATYCGGQCSEHSSEQCDFCSAVHAGLFEVETERTARVHDYLEHQDSADQAAARKARSQKAAAARWGKQSAPDSNAPSNAGSNARSIPEGNAEKRREEKRTTSDSSDALPELRSDVAALLDCLDENLRSAGVITRLPNRTKKNADAARLLLDRDKIDQDEALALIEFATHDEFWSSNIGSMSTFREKYPKLLAKMRTQQERHLRPVGSAERAYQENPYTDRARMAAEQGVPEAWL